MSAPRWALVVTVALATLVALGAGCKTARKARCPAGGPEVCRQECEEGRGTACWALGQRYFVGAEVPRDVDQARALMSRGCELGEVTACEAMGTASHTTGGTADPEADCPWLEKACKLDSPRGCFLLTGCLEKGVKSVRKEVWDITQLLRRACDGEVFFGCLALAERYDKGERGLPRDPGQAATFRDKACRYGYKPVCRQTD